MRKIHFLIILLIISINTMGQLPTGSIAPNFTATDINGNQHTLYDYLGDGKMVVLDVSATWCGPCWNFHVGHSLETLYETYGPDGTNEVMVFFVEGDANTGLEDLMGNTGSSQGNWVAGTPYPIIDDYTIADAFQISYYPTLFVICPNKEITLLQVAGSNPNASALYSHVDQCESIQIDNEVRLVKILQPKNKINCGSFVQPQIIIENNGLNTISQLNIESYIDDILVNTMNWEGEVLTFRQDTISLGEIEVGEGNHTLQVDVNNPATDNDTTDNLLSRNFSMNTNGLWAQFSLLTDNYPIETSWEIEGDEGILISSPDYTQGQFTYTDELCLDYASCYNLSLHDYSGDGMNYGITGYLELSFMGNNLVHFEGNEFTDDISQEFCVLSPENEIMSYEIPGQTDISFNAETREIIVYMPSNTDVTQLIPKFTLSEYAKAFIENVEQISDTSIVDFSLPKYYSVVADNGDEKIWAVGVQKTAGISEITINQNIAYPNPANHIIYINKNMNGKISLYDMAGSVVLQQNCNASNNTLTIENIKPGIYLLQLKTEKLNAIQKISIIHK